MTATIQAAITAAFELLSASELETVKLALDTTDNYMWMLRNGRKVVSSARALVIERATNGKIKAETLRPDIFN